VGITDDNLWRPTRRAEEHYTKDKHPTRRGAVHSIGWFSRRVRLASVRRDWTILLSLNGLLVANYVAYILLGEQEWKQATQLGVIFGVHVPIAIASLVFVGRAARRVQRRKQGFCVRCGYDIRSNVGRCSECGLPVGTR
jgi:hypothetical protein